MRLSLPHETHAVLLPRGLDNPVLTSPIVRQAATRLGVTTAGRTPVATPAVTLDRRSLRGLDGISA
jgi:hypothetical protein